VDDARCDIVQLRVSGVLDGMRLSKADFAKRWGVPRSTAWNWLQWFKSESFINSVATGMRTVIAIPSGEQPLTRAILSLVGPHQPHRRLPDVTLSTAHGYTFSYNPML
jgi:hypothetical protein